MQYGAVFVTNFTFQVISLKVDQLQEHNAIDFEEEDCDSEIMFKKADNCVY